MKWDDERCFGDFKWLDKAAETAAFPPLDNPLGHEVTFGSGDFAELRAEYKTSIEQKWCVNMDAASHVLCRMKYKYNDVSLATRGTNKISTAAILRFHNGTSFPHYVYRAFSVRCISLSRRTWNLCSRGATPNTQSKYSACAICEFQHTIGILSLFLLTADVMTMEVQNMYMAVLK